jgi:hypothetical protein
MNDAPAPNCGGLSTDDFRPIHLLSRPIAHASSRLPKNVSTLSELLRGREGVVEQRSKSGAGRIERFEGRRWCGRDGMLAMGFEFLWVGSTR